MNEIWKDVTGYEGYYQVSNCGQLRSVTRCIDRESCNIKRVVAGKIKKLQRNKLGYMTTTLYSNGKYKNVKIHRLVAIAFIPNLLNLPAVNHIDLDTSNNNVANLEWVTYQENIHHARKNGRCVLPEESKSLLGLTTRDLYSIPVVGVDIKTNKKIFFRSMTEAGRNGFKQGCISLCCKNKRVSHKGYKWRTMTPDEINRMKNEWGAKA